MTWRIRAYVAAMAVRHLGFAFAMLEDDQALEASATFRYVFELAGSRTWAGILAGVGLACLGGVLWPREAGIRLLVVASVGISCAFAAGTVLAELLEPPRASSIAAVAFAAFAAKDLIVAGMVYANPVEQIVNRDDEKAP